ncbi:MAG TPA: phosphate acetyltransferase [Candidatus Avisuccinivibrio pullicola]|nr:phosphate acetyltransferase [Candidatus Avisuccinivibrio pullicola]
MTRSVMLAPTAASVGIFPASRGLVKALCDKGVKAILFTPISTCPCEGGCSTFSIPEQKAVKLLAQGKKTELVEKVLANFYALKKAQDPAVVVVEGVVTDRFSQDEVNAAICHALDANLVVVNAGCCPNAKAQNEITLGYFGNAAKTRFLGNIVLNADAPRSAKHQRKLVLAGEGDCGCEEGSCACQKKDVKPALEKIIATIPYCPCCYELRAKDIAYVLGAEVKGDPDARVTGIALCPRCAGEHDLLIAREAAETAASVVVLTKGATADLSGKSVITTDKCVLGTLEALNAIPALLAPDDEKRAAKAAEHAAPCFDAALLDELSHEEDRIPLMSPASFRYKLTELARAAHKRIALPEGDEPRTVCAAAEVAAQGIAVPVLFGKKDEILKVAAEKGVTLGEGVEFVDPEAVRENYVDRLVELRKKKGLTPEQARDMLQDNVVLATMMIERNEVDGLVSGAVHTTANTIRPPLQIIKTAPGASLVSSVFFMLMPEQVYVFGDCAINPNPKPEELAEIAIQSADTAKTFGIDPRVAMVTYSTGTSGKGPDVDAVVEATRIAKEKRPDLNIDGPLQYDAAVMPDVAAQKAPNSPVAGKATVFIFPSLETGNTVYKAVQRSANLVSIGPMLQGMRKPVNDLSRGALVDDIIYTIAITAIQATQA